MMKIVINSDRVELHTTLASDLLYALLGTVLCACLVVGLVQAGGNLSVFVQSAGTAGRRFGPLLTPIIIMGAAPMFGAWMIGGWLRVFDRVPAICGTTKGLSFHPTFGPKNVVWNLVETLDLDGRQIAIRLRARIWSPWVWLTGRTISPYFKELGLSEARARDAITAMLALKARSVGSEFERAAPTANT